LSVIVVAGSGLITNPVLSTNCVSDTAAIVPLRDA